MRFELYLSNCACNEELAQKLSKRFGFKFNYDKKYNVYNHFVNDNEKVYIDINDVSDLIKLASEGFGNIIITNEYNEPKIMFYDDIN